MGQYFRALIQRADKSYTAYNRFVMREGKKEYMLAKLVEHSWWGNEFVEGFCNDVYNIHFPVRIAWIGDYADEIDTINKLSFVTIRKLIKKCWDVDGIAVDATDFTLQGKYLVNYSKRQYVDCNKYFENSKMLINKDVWCLHPLPLLTCIGNGRGGGDYDYPTEDSTFEHVGSWAWDYIAIEDTKPKYAELEIVFKESRWEDM